MSLVGLVPLVSCYLCALVCIPTEGKSKRQHKIHTNTPEDLLGDAETVLQEAHYESFPKVSKNATRAVARSINAVMRCKVLVMYRTCKGRVKSKCSGDASRKLLAGFPREDLVLEECRHDHNGCNEFISSTPMLGSPQMLAFGPLSKVPPPLRSR